MSDDLNWLSAREMARRFAEGELSPVDVLEATLAQLHRVNPVLNAICLLDEPLGPTPGRGVGGSLASRCAARTARRRACRDQGHGACRGLADAHRLARDVGGAEHGGYARRRPPARGRRGVLLQDGYSRIRLEGHHAWPADRHHAQSLGYFPYARRLQRRLGRIGGGRRCAAGHRRRWRRLDPHSGGVQRRVRIEAELRRGAEFPGPHGHARGLWRPVARCR